MFAPWRSKSSSHKHGYPITGNLFISPSPRAMLKENEAILNSRSDGVKKEKGTIEGG